jgi:hypothetical protein
MTNEQTGTLVLSLVANPMEYSIRRSLPNGRTDVIKAMGNTKWEDIKLK